MRALSFSRATDGRSRTANTAALSPQLCNRAHVCACRLPWRACWISFVEGAGFSFTFVTCGCANPHPHTALTAHGARQCGQPDGARLGRTSATYYALRNVKPGGMTISAVRRATYGCTPKPASALVHGLAAMRRSVRWRSLAVWWRGRHARWHPRRHHSRRRREGRHTRHLRHARHRRVRHPWHRRHRRHAGHAMPRREGRRTRPPRRRVRPRGRVRHAWRRSGGRLRSSDVARSRFRWPVDWRRHGRLEGRPIFDKVHDMLTARVVLLAARHGGVGEADVAVFAVVAWHDAVGAAASPGGGSRRRLREPARRERARGARGVGVEAPTSHSCVGYTPRTCCREPGGLLG